VLENALQYFKRVRPHVIYVNVSDTWATERMLQRHRGDDVMKSIETRLEWYKTDVVPVVEYYRTNSYYNFVEINGEQSVEAVHAEILKAIK
jgi:adenylate kinase family enzyme